MLTANGELRNTSNGPPCLRAGQWRPPRRARFLITVWSCRSCLWHARGSVRIAAVTLVAARTTCGHRKGIMLGSYAVAKGQHGCGDEARGAAGHARSDGAADARQHGPAARLRHRPAHRAGQRRHPEAERGHRLCRPFAAAAAAVDLGQLGGLGEQPQGQVLRDHRGRPASAGARGGKLGPAREPDRPAPRRRSRPDMWLGSAPASRGCCSC